MLCYLRYHITILLTLTTSIRAGVSNSGALHANLFLKTLLCAYYVEDCALQVGNHAAGSFLFQFLHLLYSLCQEMHFEHLMFRLRFLVFNSVMTN